MTCVELEDGPARATIALRGAELRRWVVDGRSLLWDPDPTIWGDTAPLLFPVVGWTKHSRIVVRDRSYPLGLHGFARHGLFRVAERSQSHVRLTLAHSAETVAVYPFAWDLAVTYVLEGNELMTELAVRNLGPAVMPYACGLHPGFRWPFADGEPEDYAIEFGEPERERQVSSTNLCLHCQGSQRIASSHPVQLLILPYLRRLSPALLP